VEFFEPAREPTSWWERSEIGMPVFEVVSSVDQAERHERADHCPASLSSEGNAGERGKCLEDGGPIESKLILKHGEGCLSTVAAPRERVASCVSDPPKIGF
jgi:hypothetical protein